MTYGFSYSELMQALAVQKAEIAASPEAASKLVDDLGIRDIYENAQQHLTIQVAIVGGGMVHKATGGLTLKGYPHHEYSPIDSRGIEIISRKTDLASKRDLIAQRDFLIRRCDSLHAKNPLALSPRHIGKTYWVKKDSHSK